MLYHLKVTAVCWKQPRNRIYPLWALACGRKSRTAFARCCGPDVRIARARTACVSGTRSEPSWTAACQSRPGESWAGAAAAPSWTVAQAGRTGAAASDTWRTWTGRTARRRPASSRRARPATRAPSSALPATRTVPAFSPADGHTRNAVPAWRTRWAGTRAAASTWVSRPPRAGRRSRSCSPPAAVCPRSDRCTPSTACRFSSPSTDCCRFSRRSTTFRLSALTWNSTCSLRVGVGCLVRFLVCTYVYGIGFDWLPI